MKGWQEGVENSLPSPSTSVPGALKQSNMVLSSSSEIYKFEAVGKHPGQNSYCGIKPFYPLTPYCTFGSQRQRVQSQDFIPLIKMKVSAGLGKKLQRSGGLIINPSSQKGVGALRHFPQCVKSEVIINSINQLEFQKHNTTWT